LHRTVTISERGREGHVTYTEGGNAITGYQEFGGGDVVAIVSMGSAKEWGAHHPWAVDRRAQILRYVADELIRQKAPTCSAEVDESRGDILLRSSGAAASSMRIAGRASAQPSSPFDLSRGSGSADVSWVRRYGEIKAKFGVFVLVVVLALCAVLWIIKK